MTKYDYRQKQMGDSYYHKRPKKTNRLWRSFLFLVVVAFIVALFIYVFPRVEITLVPETEAIENDFEIKVDANLPENDYSNSQIRGEIVVVEEAAEKTFPTTGQKNVGDKARGTVVFFNQTGLVQPLTTENELVNDKGIVFYAVHNLDIPKAEVSAEGNIVYGSASIEVEAKEAGEEGNIMPGRLTIIDLPFSKQNKIYGEVKSRLSGGTDKKIKVASAEDLEKAEADLIDELNPKLKSKIKDRAGDKYYLENDLIEFKTLAVDKTVELEEEIDAFTISVKMRATALVWDEKKLKETILGRIEFDDSNGKQIIPTSQDIFEVEVIEHDLEAKTAALKIHTKNQVSLPIDIAAIKDEVKGLAEFEARRLLLAKDNINDVMFKFNYSITSRIPKNGNRINVSIKN